MNPTGQVKSKAKKDGFDNVHDWLVFQNTGESAEAIAARKADAPWGAASGGALCAGQRARASEEAEQEGAAPGGKKRRVSKGKGDSAATEAPQSGTSERGAPTSPAGVVAEGALVRACHLLKLIEPADLRDSPCLATG